MIHKKAICLKDYTGNGLILRKDMEYDVSLKNNDRLIIFTKRGWYEVGEWEEYLQIVENN